MIMSVCSHFSSISGGKEPDNRFMRLKSKRVRNVSLANFGEIVPVRQIDEAHIHTSIKHIRYNISSKFGLWIQLLVLENCFQSVKKPSDICRCKSILIQLEKMVINGLHYLNALFRSMLLLLVK